MALKVSIIADSKFPIDRKRIRAAMVRAWDGYGINVDATLALSVVGTRKMAFLHEEYLHKKGATDVLAFPQQNYEGDEHGFVTPEDTPLQLGDVVVCFPLAIDQAAKLGVLVDDRIEELALHGFQNLMGNQERE